MAYQDLTTNKSYLSDFFLNRVRRSYRLAAREDAANLDSMWSTIGNIQRPVHQALASNTNDDLRKIFADPAISNLYFGVDPIRVHSLPPIDKLDEVEAYERKHEHLCWGLLLTLAQALGVRRWLPEQSELFEHYRSASPIVEPDLEEVLSSIESVIGFRFHFPNPFSREAGVRTSRGIASFRALQALYQTYRIIQELHTLENQSILEIGPGIGRTIYYAWQAGIRDYTTVDLPLGVAAQACFLGAVLGPDAIWLMGDDPALTIGRVRLLPSTAPMPARARIGLVLNADSITEMGSRDSARYAQWIAEHADVFLSINHEFNPPLVVELAKQFFTHATPRRFPYWMRPGWIEEVFRFSETRPSVVAKTSAVLGFPTPREGDLRVRLLPKLAGMCRSGFRSFQRKLRPVVRAKSIWRRVTIW